MDVAIILQQIWRIELENTNLPIAKETCYKQHAAMPNKMCDKNSVKTLVTA
jgi:hypothetical protein